MTLKAADIIDIGGWIPLREVCEDACPHCGFKGPHSVSENEDGEMRSRCNECYVVFGVYREEVTSER